MPKCSMWPPTASSAAGITSRRSAIAEAPNTMTSSAPALSTSSIARAKRRTLVRHAPLGDDRGAGRREPLGGDLRASSRSPSARARAATSRPRRPCGCDRARRASAAALHAGQRRIARRFGDRERDDLHGRDHLAGDHRLEGRQRRERDRLVDAIERVDRRPCRRPARRRVCANRLARPVKARSTCTPSPATASAISAAATSSETSPGSSRATTISLMPAASSAATSAGADQRALLEHQAALADGMHRGGADAPPCGGTGPNFMTPPPQALAPAPARSRAVISRHDRDRDLGRRDRADVEPDRRMDAREIGVAQRPAPSAARRGARGFSASRARRYRSNRAPARASAPDRRSSDRG